MSALRNVKFLACSISLLLFTATAFCQSNEKFEYFPFKKPQHYLQFGTGWNYWYGRDKGMLTELIHKGGHINGNLGWEKISPKYVTQIKLSPYAGNISSQFNYYDIPQFGFNFHFFYQHRITPIKPIKTGWYGGASFDLSGALRRHPQFTNHIDYEWINSFSLASSIKRSFYFIPDHPIVVDLKLSLPLVSQVVRPLYTQSVPGEIVLNDQLAKGIQEWGQITSWGDLIRVNTDLSITYFLKNKNGVRLGYTWDYYKYDAIEINTVNAGLHQVYCAILFNF